MGWGKYFDYFGLKQLIYQKTVDLSLVYKYIYLYESSFSLHFLSLLQSLAKLSDLLNLKLFNYFFSEFKAIDILTAL